jgi:hypothetical protein
LAWLVSLLCAYDPQHLPRPYTFSSLHEYKAALRQTGQILKDDVAAGKIDLSDQPVVIGLTG